jgi:hypothetical protein
MTNLAPSQAEKDAIDVAAQGCFVDLGMFGGRFFVDPDSSCPVLNAKFYPIGVFLNADLRQFPSSTWSRIRSFQDIFRNCHSCKLRNGSIMNIWGEPPAFVECRLYSHD